MWWQLIQTRPVEGNWCKFLQNIESPFQQARNTRIRTGVSVYRWSFYITVTGVSCCSVSILVHIYKIELFVHTILIFAAINHDKALWNACVTENEWQLRKLFQRTSQKQTAKKSSDEQCGFTKFKCSCSILQERLSPGDGGCLFGWINTHFICWSSRLITFMSIILFISTAKKLRVINSSKVIWCNAYFDIPVP